MKVGLEEGRPVDSWYYERADLGVHSGWILQEFFELSTERQIGFALGPIPSKSIRDQMNEVGLKGASRAVYQHLIRVLDSDFMSYHEELQDAKRQK